MIHEAAHIAAGALLGLKVETVTLSPLGADIGYRGVIPYKAEIPLALSGPFASVVSAFFALLSLNCVIRLSSPNMV